MMGRAEGTRGSPDTEVAPAYLSDTDAADVLALLCEEIGEEVGHGLAARRYAITSDRRALHGTVL
ncbi:hypothetical protein [Streptomyces sp. NPDC046631]|uniref:hypothetical protein n=1 Tax=unclassified Streptomyces TaxID=2593676 RepID=UPI0034033D94